MDDTKVNGLWKVLSISITDKNSNTASYSYTSMDFSAGRSLLFQEELK